MKLRRPIFRIVLLAFCFSPAARAQVKDSPQSTTLTKSEASLKLLKSPVAPFPEEALRKNIEGKVELTLTVNAQGRVSDAKILSGPPELYQAALDSVKQWQFEPPAHAPAETKASVIYVTQSPVRRLWLPWVSYSSQQAHKWQRHIVGIVDAMETLQAKLLAEDMKSGASAIWCFRHINANGKLTKIRIVHSLSSHLDKVAIKAVRDWRFKLQDGSPGSLPDTFPLVIKFDPECNIDL